MKTTSFLMTLIGVMATLGTAHGASLPLTTDTYSEDFDTLALSGTSSTTPTGWGFLESLANANATYTAGTGSSSGGDTYSFGAASTTERAFGEVTSSGLHSTIGVAIENQTGSTIESLLLSYTGEQWRLGAIGRADRLDFQFSTDATALDTGTWTDLNSLDFVAPVNSGATGALDGNDSAHRTALSDTLSGLTLAQGDTIWFRWTPVDATGSDDGLAIDDFALRVISDTQPVPEPGTWGLASGCFLGMTAFMHSRRSKRGYGVIP
jgi:hypothetical protein